MDWNQFDPEGAIRQRYLDIDEVTEEINDKIELTGWDRDEFKNIYDISWIHHENGLEGVVLAYPEIRSAVDNKIVSDVSLLPTYRDIKAQKTCIDMMRDKAQARRSNITIKLLTTMHGLLLDDPEKSGTYRKDIPIHRTYFHEIAEPTLIETRLSETLDYVNGKKDRDLHVRVENPDEFVYFHMKNPDLPAITQGRIGLRHMFTRSARYTNFRVWQPRSGKVR